MRCCRDFLIDLVDKSNFSINFHSRVQMLDQVEITGEFDAKMAVGKLVLSKMNDIN